MVNVLKKISCEYVEKLLSKQFTVSRNRVGDVVG